MIRNTKLMSDSMKEVRAVESHDCEKIHPTMNHLDWVAQNKDAKNNTAGPLAPPGCYHVELITGKQNIIETWLNGLEE